jgi:POT family proton-dependent oligopeptide transporter
MSTTTTDAHLNKIFLVTQLDYIYFLPKCGSVLYYGMRALLVLYMTSSTLGDDARGAGLGWTSQEALALYGWYTMLVYIMSILEYDCDIGLGGFFGALSFVLGMVF